MLWKTHEMLNKILILAGGGGHTSIALAIAQTLHREMKMSFFVPENDWLSEKLLISYGEVKRIVKMRDPLGPNYLLPIKFSLSLIQSLIEIKGFSLVISCGSNFCIPPAIVSWFRKIPLINIESRVAIQKASETAKILQHISTLTLLQWDEQKENLAGIVVGPIFPRLEYKPRKGGYILVTGGTEGHKKLFDAMSETDLKNVVLQTGKINPKPYKEKHPEWKVFTLSDNFPKILAGADLIITHQGGGTIFEAIMYNKPLIIVPNKNLKRTASLQEISFLSNKLKVKIITNVSAKKLLTLIQNMKQEQYPKLDNGTKQIKNIVLYILKKI